MMGHVITTPRSTRSPLLLLLLSSCCLHLTFADVSSAIPATFIQSSIEHQGSVDQDGPSALSLNPCATLETGCTQDPTAEFQLPHHLLEKRSSYELRTLPDTVIVPKGNGGLEKLETASGYRVGNTGNKVNRPTMDSRPIWNAPFRVVYGSSGRNLVKFGKRSATNLFDGYRFKFGKRSVDVVEKRMIKFGKRIDAVSDDQGLSSAEEDKRMIKFGKRNDDLQDDQKLETEEEKRLIRFGKRVGDLQDDSKLETEEEKRLIRFGKRVGDLQDDQGLESGEDKRMIKFGKRADDLQDPELEAGEEKRLIRFGKRVDNNWSDESKLSAEAEKRMIKFGKRFDHLPDDDQNNSAGEEKRMFKLGKRIDDDPQEDLNLVNEEEKRKFSFGKRILDTHVVPNLFGGEEARISKVGEWSEALPEAENLGEYGEEEEKRMIKFGKKADGFNDGKVSELEAQTKELVQYPDKEEKRMIKFGKKSEAIDADVTPSEDVKRKIMFGKRSDANWENGQDTFDDGGLNSMETDVQEQLPPPEKRRQKFQFGRRLAPRQDELFAKVRSKFKLGKRSE